MNSEQFSYWLQGYAEICGTEPTVEQWQIIKDHLQLVFQKVTPGRANPFPFRDGKPITWPLDTVKTSTPLQPLRAECVASPQIGAVTLC